MDDEDEEYVLIQKGEDFNVYAYRPKIPVKPRYNAFENALIWMSDVARSLSGKWYWKAERSCARRNADDQYYKRQHQYDNVTFSYKTTLEKTSV